MREGIVTIRANDTDSFLQLFADDPDTVYPVILTTRTLSRPSGAGYTSWLTTLYSPEELEELIGDNSLHGQYPYSFCRTEKQTNIDLESGGGFPMGEAVLETYGLLPRSRRKNRFVPIMADREMMEAIYHLVIKNGLLLMG